MFLFLENKDEYERQKIFHISVKLIWLMRKTLKAILRLFMLQLKLAE